MTARILRWFLILPGLTLAVIGAFNAIRYALQPHTNIAALEDVLGFTWTGDELAWGPYLVPGGMVANGLALTALGIALGQPDARSSST